MTDKMNTLKKYALLYSMLLVTASGFCQNFKVVLDAGHGGDDSGTHHNGYKEKEIVLSTVLKIGKILESEPGLEVIYTRKTDVFVELRERANHANRERADLFVSVHCNGVNNAAAYGTETFVMGLNRSDMNLDVAKQENSVIFKEKGHEKNYGGFDPNRPETTLLLRLGQEENINRSLVLATRVKNGFKGLERHDRGIKQIPLWVLDATTMPGVLIELGFVSNKNEGAYLDSEAGQNELARTIANAIISYKDLMTGNKVKEADFEKPISTDKETVPVVKQKEETPEAAAAADGVVFKVQISASSRDLATTPSNFKGLKKISKVKEGKLIRYFYGETGEYQQTGSLVSAAKAKGFSAAFVVPFKNGKIISMQEALK